jgi:Fe-S-cluster containining protein
MTECLDCGACCFSTLETYVRVTGDDYARLGDRAGDLVHWHGNRAYMRVAQGRCAALAIVGGRFVCTIYDARPQTCRDLARGSRECEGERATKGDRPALANMSQDVVRPRHLASRLGRGRL